MRILVVWMFSRTVKRTMRVAMSVIEVISHFLAAFGRHSTYLIKPRHGQEWQTANFRFCWHNSIMFQKIPGACSGVVPDGVSLIWQWLNKKWARYSKCPTSGWCPKSGLGIVVYESGTRCNEDGSTADRLGSRLVTRPILDDSTYSLVFWLGGWMASGMARPSRTLLTHRSWQRINQFKDPKMLTLVLALVKMPVCERRSVPSIVPFHVHIVSFHPADSRVFSHSETLGHC